MQPKFRENSPLVKTAEETARYDNDVPKTIDIDRAGKMVEKYAAEGKGGEGRGGEDGRRERSERGEEIGGGGR